MIGIERIEIPSGERLDQGGTKILSVSITRQFFEHRIGKPLNIRSNGLQEFRYFRVCIRYSARRVSTTLRHMILEFTEV